MRNEITKAVLEVLRQSPEPLSTQEIALELVIQRTIDWRGSLDAMIERITPTLKWYRKRGVLASQRDGSHVMWKIAT